MTLRADGQVFAVRSEPAAFPRAERFAIGLAVAIGLLGAMRYWWGRGSLWEDEIIAVTHGLQPLPLFFVEVLRFDIHPPLYFLLLKGWRMAGLGSDAALLASSLFASLASAAVIAAVAARLAGARACGWALALTCVLPNFAWAAGNLRMYGLVPGLIVALWFLWRRYLLQGGAIWMVAGSAVELLLAYTHAIEFYFIVFVMGALWLELRLQAAPARLGRALGAQIGLGVCMLPLVASALLRGTEPLGASSLSSLLLAPAQLLTGWALAQTPWALAAGGLAGAGLLLLAITDRGARCMVLGITGAAVLTAIVIGFLGKPMFKPPVFTANLVPFLTLAAALGVARSRAAWVSALAIAWALGLAAVTLPWSARLHPPENFGPAGAYLAAQAKPGDTVVVPRSSVYWGVLRYAAATDWGQPLSIAPPANAQWTRLKEELGPRLAQALGLEASGDFVDWKGVRYVFGTQAVLRAGSSGRVWLVHRIRYADAIRLDRPVAEQSVQWFGNELSVSLVTVQAGGQTELAAPRPPAGSADPAQAQNR
jgi:hypothetical protein